ncbi:MAG: hypothetical protein P8Y16_02045, partial [Sulfurimonas sp.]
TASVFVFSLISALSLSVTQSAQAIENTLPLNEVRTFVDIFDRIKKAYVEEVDDKTLLENAIKGMLSELDPHSAYLDPKAFNDLQINTTGEFGGLGIEVGMENNFIKTNMAWTVKKQEKRWFIVLGKNNNFSYFR